MNALIYPLPAVQVDKEKAITITKPSDWAQRFERGQMIMLVRTSYAGDTYTSLYAFSGITRSRAMFNLLTFNTGWIVYYGHFDEETTKVLRLDPWDHDNETEEQFMERVQMRINARAVEALPSPAKDTNRIFLPTAAWFDAVIRHDRDVALIQNENRALAAERDRSEKAIKKRALEDLYKQVSVLHEILI